MAMKYTKIPANTFESLQMNAGILLRKFDPTEAKFEASDIIGATTGGVSFTDVPEYVDFADDIDNAAKNMLEFKKISGREVTLSGTYVSVDKALLKSLIGSADVNDTKIVPRDVLRKEDFEDVWLVADYSAVNEDTEGGKAGYIAIHVMNALNTGGFSLQTADAGKGQFAFSYVGHYSIENQDQVPYEIYIQAGTGAEGLSMANVTGGTKVSTITTASNKKSE